MTGTTDETSALFATALAWLAEGHRVALATVIETWGSAPRAVGSHMVVRDDGRFEGSVSGGCVEGDVIVNAQAVLEQGSAVRLDYGVSNSEAWTVGLACGGKISVLAQPVDGEHFAPTLMLHILAERQAGRSVTVRTQLAEGRSEAVVEAGPEGDCFLNIYAPPLRLAIVGAVHIAQALVPMARMLGYAPFVIDPRGAFAAGRFEGLEVSPLWPDEALRGWEPDGRSAVVTLTHDPKLDDPALATALASPAFYIAALGSRKTHGARLERLRAEGFGEADLARIHGPAGLAIGAKTPAEIAISIAAQMTAALRMGERVMLFGPVPPRQAVGAVLAHSMSVGGVRLRKGSVLTAEDCARLEAAGLADVVVAQLGADDVPEDEAARRLAEALANVAGSVGLRVGRANTGRCNLYAESAGLVTFEAEAVHRLNMVDEAITLATLPPETRVQPGDVAATIKIIPYAVPYGVMEAAERAARDVQLRLAPFRPMSVALLQTQLAGQKHELFAKTERVTAARLARLGLKVDRAELLPHDTALLAEALRAATEDLILIVGASAIADRRDVIPAAVTAAGGQVERLGMPVDPGNLLCLARLGKRPAIGLPGCARSPKRNGLDMVLERLVAGLPVESQTISRMGVGGLIDEIPERPAPRLNTDAPESERGPVGAIILAAGQSRRMGPINKLLIEVDGLPLLVHVVRAVRAAGLPPPVVVTGCEAEQVREALRHEPVRFAHNPDYAEGLSTSIRTGIEEVPESWAGALVCLGDMPEVTPETLKALASAFNPATNASICAPVHNGKRGNPVLWGRQHFARLKALSGDVGAKHLLAELNDQVAEVGIPSPGVLTDVDTPEALQELLARLPD